MGDPSDLAPKGHDPKANWTKKDNIDGRWSQTDVGPFLASVVETPNGKVAKGLTVRLGDKQQLSALYDLKTCSLRAVWSGGFLTFDPYKFGVVRTPKVEGDVRFTGPAESWPGLRTRHHRLYQHGQRVQIQYTIHGDEEYDWGSVYETPWTVGQTLIRDMTVAAGIKNRRFVIMEVDPKAELLELSGASVVRSQDGGKITAVALLGDSKALTLKNNIVYLTFRSSKAGASVRILTWVGTAGNWPLFEAQIRKIAPLKHEPSPLPTPLGLNWPHRIAVKGVLGRQTGAFALDTIPVPFDNPYKALMFLSGLDFFANGDIAVSTLHGDVWVVRGVDDKLENVTWKRYATGLHQPLGLRIVKDKVYVLGKDQITRLLDTNGDDEADVYDNFNNDGDTSLGGHDYASCLETDPAGNFYYIRAHEGVCRVSADGKRHESIAAGFRNPVGLGVGPDGTITASPQEGDWTPASAIFQVKAGGYYGFGGPRVTPERPLGYDPPLCWLPRLQDNSSGGQVWVTSDRWGPLKGQMLHLSYGQCAMMLVLREKAGGQWQGGTVKFPLRFASGVMRGRFSPRDGQLYVVGMRGWQTSAVRDGCLQRVRYTGRPMDMPTSLRTRPDGVELSFDQPLDQETATDPDSYLVERWNYRYAKEYGSKDYKLSNPDQVGHDTVAIEGISLSDDRRTVRLRLRDMKPAMQMMIAYSIETESGRELRDAVFSTVHRVGATR